jgi:hypothetical protein
MASIECLIVAFVKPKYLGPLSYATFAAERQGFILFLFSRLGSVNYCAPDLVKFARVVEIEAMKARSLDSLITAHLIDTAMYLKEALPVRSGL